MIARLNSATGSSGPAESALLSPTAPGCVPQDHLEQVLLDHLRALPHARVDVGVELIGLENDATGVRAVDSWRSSHGTPSALMPKAWTGSVMPRRSSGPRFTSPS